MNNKENMLKVALDLFSKKGYRAVSVRDICGELNLKESALYYHFKNKQALLDELYQQILTLIENMKASFDQAFSPVTTVSLEEMKMVSAAFLTNYLCNPLVSKFISMLSIERLSDSKAWEVYKKLIYEMPLEQCEKVFKLMIQKKIVKAGEEEKYSKIYYSIIFNAYNEHVFGRVENKKVVEKAVAQVNQEIEAFYKLIKIK